MLKGALEDFTLRILIVAAIVSIIISMSTAKKNELKTAWIEGVAILIAVAVCSMVGATVFFYLNIKIFAKNDY